MTSAKRKLMAIKPPPSIRETQMRIYRSLLVKENMQRVDEYAKNEMRTEKYADAFVDRFLAVVQRIDLLSIEIDKEVESRGLYLNPADPAGPYVTAAQLES
ncbi:MAG: hypothetical protein WAM96_11570 [Candidatus Acidiferrales bacterium]